MNIESIQSRLKNVIKAKKQRAQITNEELNQYEFCPRCEANITLQKGYRNELPYWICKGCGQLLTNPNNDWESEIAWICDSCGTLLNTQPGFREDCGTWCCCECGFENRINESEIYASEDEYQSSAINPYKGLGDEEVLKLSMYTDEELVNGRNDIILVKNIEDGKYYIKKLLKTYEKSVYDYLVEHPIDSMPRIYELYESDNALILIEEYLQGNTIEEIINKEPLPERKAIEIVEKLCTILDELHNQPKPIIHRDIKPSNILVDSEDKVYLLDMNVAKWYEQNKTEDTKYMGTMGYAAPEQVGYGFSASSNKTDIYAVGVLLNVLITGKFPKEEHAKGPIWDIIKKCISLEAKDRYSAVELREELNKISRNN
ncbi:Protein kinase domain-containing protein [Pseudobutyrivibrio sp. C4]|uniref:serine/threonine protein kinase n=1 Tax=Pseudobutyrivibrio sp. C4 TaxID=1520803 RepID=UPI0008C303E9|nr:protein kinase [Pseudobutyrivibrio sp. C4]SES91329.1 Protein kinase domain-containing protein [Pseudobutyrivibrio sp. C4]